MVSFSITVIGTAGSLALTISSAYGLSKTQVPGNKFFMWYIIVAMLFNAGIIPTYYIVNNVLNLTDTYAALVIPFLASPFSIILMRNFFWSIPAELEESMMIDGASYLTMLWRLVIPLSKAAIATIGLFYAVGHWNDFFRGLIYIRDNSKWPLPVLMRGIVIQQQYHNMENFNTMALRQVLNPDNIRAATIIFSIVPVLMVYPFIQKYFTKGIMIGAVKG
jgi:putative aldouronate transport system permease protein